MEDASRENRLCPRKFTIFAGVCGDAHWTDIYPGYILRMAVQIRRDRVTSGIFMKGLPQVGGSTVIYKVTCISCAANDSRGISTIVPSSAMILKRTVWVRCGLRRNRLGGREDNAQVVNGSPRALRILVKYTVPAPAKTDR